MLEKVIFQSFLYVSSGFAGIGSAYFGYLCRFGAFVFSNLSGFCRFGVFWIGGFPDRDAKMLKQMY